MFVSSPYSDMFVSRPHSATRICARCQQPKSLSEFAWRRRARGQLDNYCRVCRAAYKRQHYAANRERYIAKASRRKRAVVAARTAELITYFKDHACVDCDESDPLVLEFDHLEDKRFGIAQGLRDRNWQAVLTEIGKCDVVCANCHRRRTARRAGFARAVVAQW